LLHPCVSRFIFEKETFFKVDYHLLLTFIRLFLFIGIIADTAAVQSFVSCGLQTTGSVFFNSVLASRLISNVPASILLGEFTDNWRTLLLASILGIGQPSSHQWPASSPLNFYFGSSGKTKEYLIRFSLYNFGLLPLFTAVHFFLLY